MKIKTITCHNVYNAGASLQAYALAEYLNSIGHECQIIDYKPDYLKHYKLFGVSNPRYNKPVLRELYNIAKFPGRLKARFGKRKKEYDRFTEDYLPVTNECYTSNEELKSNPPEADIFFAGSDQIWNSFFNNGKDPAFYLDFAPIGTVKASYAASFATENIATELKPQVKEWLSNMDYISVREGSGLNILNDLGIQGAVQVLDPVFLLPKEKWESIIEYTAENDSYILLYDFDKNEQLGLATRELAHENGWKVYSYLDNPYCDRCFKNAGPRAFLGLIKNAEMVISNSFHATAFSLIFEKNFWVINRTEAINTRMRDLTSLVGVPERFLNDTDIDLLIPINYETVNQNISRELKNSTLFIDYVMKEANKELDR